MPLIPDPWGLIREDPELALQLEIEFWHTVLEEEERAMAGCDWRAGMAIWKLNAWEHEKRCDRCRHVVGMALRDRVPAFPEDPLQFLFELD